MPEHASPSATLNELVAIKTWALSVAFENRLAAELSEFGMSVAAFRLIGVLMQEPGGLRQGEIAKRLNVRAPTVSAAVARLEKDGLIHRIADPNDSRARLVSIAQNASLLPGIEVLGRMEALLTAGMSAHDLAALKTTLDELTVRLNEGVDDAG